MNLLWLALSALAADPPALPAPPATADATVAAGTLLVDAHVPVEILLNGVKLGQLYVPGETRFHVVTGKHLVRVYTNGNPTDLEVEIGKDAEARVLVGRTGVTMAAGVAAPPPDAAVPVPVEFRVHGTPGAQLRLDDGRHAVTAGTTFTVALTPGPHRFSVRSADGTAIWATGTLDVTGTPVVVQITEGRMPEVSGSATFHASGS